MLVKFIYPLTDVRPFLDGPTHRIRVPAFAEPKLSNFVRDFGSFKVKREKWKGPPEEYFCTAHHSLKISGFRTFIIPVGEKALRANRLVRRFYSRWNEKLKFFFHWVEVTFDLVLVDSTDPNAGLQIDETGLIEALNQLVQIEVKVPVFGENKTNGKDAKKKKYKLYNLGNVGSGLANLYLHSSSQYQEQPNLQKWWVRSGLPMVVVHCRRDDLVKRPCKFQPIQKTGLSKLFLDYYRLSFRRLFLHAWVLRSKSTKPTFEVGSHHRLQQRLSQLFTEYEHFKEIVRAIAYKQMKFPALAEKKDRLTNYLTRSIDLLTRPKYNGIKQEGILAQFGPDYRDFLTDHELQRLTEQLISVHPHPNFPRKVVNFAVTGGKQSVPLDQLGLMDPKRGGGNVEPIPNSALKVELGRLRPHIANGKLPLAFDTLQSLINRASTLNKFYKTQLFSLCFQYNHLEEDKRRNVLSMDEYRLTCNRIVNSLSEIIETIISDLSIATS